MRKGKKAQSKQLRDYLQADFLLATNDAIIGEDKSLSIIRVIEQVSTLAFPAPLSRFVIVVQFSRKLDLQLEEIDQAGITYKVVLINPKGSETHLQEFSLPLLQSGKDSVPAPWMRARTIIDMSQGRLILSQPGHYTLRLLGRTNETEYEPLIDTIVTAKLIPGVPGFYSVQFSIDEIDPSELDKQGLGGIFLLPDLTIQGGDDSYDYTGTYRLEKGSLSANVSIKRKTPGHLSIFGDVDEFDLILFGEVSDEGVMVLHGHPVSDESKKFTVAMNRQAVLPIRKPDQ